MALSLFISLPFVGSWLGWELGSAYTTEKYYDNTTEVIVLKVAIPGIDGSNIKFTWYEELWPNIPELSERAYYEELVASYILRTDSGYHDQDYYADIQFHNLNDPATESEEGDFWRKKPDVLVQSQNFNCGSAGCPYDMWLDLQSKHEQRVREAIEFGTRISAGSYSYKRLLPEFDPTYGTRLLEVHELEMRPSLANECETGSGDGRSVNEITTEAWDNAGHFQTVQTFTCEETLQRLKTTQIPENEQMTIGTLTQ
jgi:hypothetical protein